MRFYLVKNANVVEDSSPPTGSSSSLPNLLNLHLAKEGFALQESIILNNVPKVGKRCFATFSTEIPSLIPMTSEKDGYPGRFWSRTVVKRCARKIMRTLTDKIKSSTVGNHVTNKISVSAEITMVHLNTDSDEVKRTDDQRLVLSVVLGECSSGRNNVLKCLHDIFGNRLKVSVELFFVTRGGSPSPTRAGLLTKEMPLDDGSKDGYDRVFCIDKTVPATDKMERFWLSDHDPKPLDERFRLATCNIILTMDDNDELFSTVIPVDTNRKILEGAVGSDFEIVASNGAIIKCHKNFLSVSSPVLAAMLRAGMSESSTNKMEMPDMSQAGLHAFLDFLYCDEIDEPKRNNEVAFELLQAGHKYEIQRLERGMMKLLCDIPDIYITAEFAMRLFQFVKNIPNGEKLKEKLMQIIILEMPVINPVYEELCKDSPETFLNLVKFNMQVIQDSSENRMDYDDFSD